MLYWSHFTLILYQGTFINLQYSHIFWRKYEIMSFTSSITKDITVFSVWSRFPVELFYCIALGSASTAFFLRKSIAMKLHFLKKISILK